MFKSLFTENYFLIAVINLATGVHCILVLLHPPSLLTLSGNSNTIASLMNEILDIEV